MLESSRAVRIAAVVTALGAIGLAFGIRALAGGAMLSNGALQQNSGTALYACAVYAAVVFVVPSVRPVAAGAGALVICWAVEFFQVTGVPHELSRYTVIGRLVFGDAFDWLDVAWYPAGILPLVLLHLWGRSVTSR